MTPKNTTNFPRALLADVFGALHSESPLTPGSLLHAAIGEASRALRLASIALQRGELLARDLEAIRRQLTIADDFAEWLADEEDERGQSDADPQPDSLRKAIDLCKDEIIDDIATALGRLEDARRARPDGDPQPDLDQAVMESHNAVTAAFRKLAGSLRSAPGGRRHRRRAAIEALRALRDHSAVGDHGTAVGEIVEELEDLCAREGGVQ